MFFSRDAGGGVQRGLDGIPRRRPLLFVGNHQVPAAPLPASLAHHIAVSAPAVRHSHGACRFALSANQDLGTVCCRGGPSSGLHAAEVAVPWRASR